MKKFAQLIGGVNYCLRFCKAWIRRKTRSVQIAPSYRDEIKIGFAPVKNGNFDFQKNLQVINGVMDLFLKLGALSVILGAVTVHGYLAGIGGKILYPQFLGSQGGIFSVTFGLALLFMLLFFSLMISPLLLRYLKNVLTENRHLNSFSFVRTFFAIFLGQLFFLVASVLGSVQLIWIAMPVLAAACVVLFNREKRSPLQFFLIIVLCVPQLLSILPWVYLLDIVAYSGISGVYGLGKDWGEIFGFFVWIGVYSLAVAAYVNYKKADSKESPLSYLKGLLVFCAFLMCPLLLISPNFFVNTSMSVASLRQTQKQSTWWYVDGTAYSRISRVGSSYKSLKNDGGNSYLCGYSPFMYSERIVLCPQKIETPNLKSCYVFASTEVRPATVLDQGWDCGK